MSARALPSHVPSVRLTPTNHGAEVILAAAIMLGVSVLALSMRFYQRWPISRLMTFEDGIVIGALATAIGNVAAVSVAVHAGLGQHANVLTSSRISQTRTALTATYATAFLAQGLAAISFVLLLRSFSSIKTYQTVNLGLVAFIALWTLAAVVRFAIGDVSSLAQPMLASWIVFGAISVLIQITSFISAIWMILPLRMPLSRKLEVSFWFVLCIPCVIAATVTRLVYTPSRTFSVDFTWDDTTMVVILLVETNLMIVSAACPSFRNLLTSVSTGFLVAETTTHSRSKKEGSSSGGGSYILNSLGRRIRGEKPHSVTVATANTKTGTDAVAANGLGDAKSVTSFGSEAVMVRRSVDIEVTTPIDMEDERRLRSRG